jgi:hypothetical protein
MMTRKFIVLTGCLIMSAVAAMAQDRMPGRVNTYTDEGTGTGFRKENLFVGGSLGLGFVDYQFSIGVNPEIGYSLNRWLDAGVVVNFTYNSVSPDPSGVYNPDLSEKEFIYGGGLFARVYVLPAFFLTAQPEFNWTHDRQVYEGRNGGTYVFSANAPSLLLGLGYGRRMIGQGTFWLAVMLDVLGNTNSPYNDIYGHPLPVIRAGFDLFPHKR